MVTQPPGVNARRNEVMAEGIHLEQRRKLRHVAKVISIRALGQRRARCRFGGNNAKVCACQLTRNERKSETTEVAAAPTAGDQYVRSLTSQGELLDGFQADHSLVQEHVVQDTAQRVFRIGP